MNSLLNLVILTLGLSRVVSAEDCIEFKTQLLEISSCLAAIYDPPKDGLAPSFSAESCCGGLEMSCVWNKLKRPECKGEVKLGFTSEDSLQKCKHLGIDMKSETPVEKCAEMAKAVDMPNPSCNKHLPCPDTAPALSSLNSGRISVPDSGLMLLFLSILFTIAFILN